MAKEVNSVKIFIVRLKGFILNQVKGTFEIFHLYYFMKIIEFSFAISYYFITFVSKYDESDFFP